MKYWFWFLVVITALPSVGQERLSEQEAKEDLGFLYRRMIKVHPGLYAYQDSADYANTFQEIFDSIEGEIEYLEFYKRMSPLITEIKDLHTSYRHSKQWSKEHDKALPFILQELDNEYYLKYNASSDSTMMRGDKVVAIAGHDIKELVNEVKTYLGTDNDNELAKNLYASKNLYAYYGRIYELTDSVRVNFTREPDSSFFKTLKTIKRKEVIPEVLKRYPDKARVKLDYTLLDSTLQVGEIDISSFSYKGGPFDLFQRKFKHKLKKSFKKVAEDSLKHLVLDLRSNGGGYIPNVKRLMKYVANEPFYMIDTMAFKKSAYGKLFPVPMILPPLMAPLYFNKKDSVYRFHVNTKKVKPRFNKYHFDGPLYVYLDANSYSATVFTAALLKDMNRATFLGTIPAGTTWGSYAGSFHLPKLPNSKIQLRIPYYKVVHGLSKKPQEQFLKPDIPIELTKEQFHKDIDPYQEKLLDHITNLNQQ
ncbi:S41 family peptidase [Jiulongibacter sp. NS-SX5]|uniref:S41 family peptidase n=1 Tax=Jiulongibacter sp. NS-SX5 TaxID=3463854 RepID=UPI00405934D4